MKFAWVVLATLALFSSNAGRAQRTPVAITVPEASAYGPIMLVVIDYQRALPNGGWYCPEAMGPDEICHGSSIVEGPMRIVRRLSNGTEGWRSIPLRPRIRFLGGHAVRWVDAGRQLAIIEQTDEGYFWRAWSTPVVGGWACIDPVIVERFRIEGHGRLRPHGGQSHCYRIPGSL